MPLPFDVIRMKPKFNYFFRGLSAKFCENLLNSFWVILLTSKQTNKLTDADESITSLAEAISHETLRRSAGHPVATARTTKLADVIRDE